VAIPNLSNDFSSSSIRNISDSTTPNGNKSFSLQFFAVLFTKNFYLFVANFMRWKWKLITNAVFTWRIDRHQLIVMQEAYKRSFDSEFDHDANLENVVKMKVLREVLLLLL
jgi:hypothetical protein